MLPTRVLLGLFGLTVVNGISIQIDLEDSTTTLNQGQVALVDETFNSTVYPTDDRTFDAPACPGKCPMDIACPSAHKGVRIGSKGGPYYIYCNMGVNADSNRVEYLNMGSLDKCVDLCEKTNWCIAAQLQASNGACYLIRHITKAFAQAGMHSAVKMTLDFPRSAKCPDDNGKIISSNYDRQYKIYCDYDQSSSMKSFSNVRSYEECVNNCDETPGCASASMDDKTTCWAYPLYQVPPSGEKIKAKPGYAVFVQQSGIPKQQCCPARE